MAETSFPWNGSSTGDATTAPYDANTEWADLQKGYGNAGSSRNDAGVVLGSGAESAALEGLAVTQNSPTGASVLVNIGRALVDGTWYKNTAAVTVTVAANASGNPRIDTVILRKSFAAQTVRIAILQGTPAASPVPPTLTQSAGVTWEIPLADIAVANGFVSITNSNITPRFIPYNGADGVYLDRILNSSGGTLQTGDAVIGSLGSRAAVTSGALPLYAVARGAWLGRTANSAYGRVLNRGIGYIRTDAAVSGSNFGALGTTAGAVTPTNEALINTFVQFMESTSGAGLALAFIDGGIRPQFGQLAVTNKLSGASASIAITGMPALHNTLIIEFHLRSAAVATTDTVNLRFGGAALDTTAANYFSIRTSMNVGTTVAGAENLGATAGIQMFIPGSTAPANAFTFGWLIVNNAIQSTLIKHVFGMFFTQINTTTTNLYTNLVAGRWLNTANNLLQLSLISNGGSNLAADSYINVYAKQTWGS